MCKVQLTTLDNGLKILTKTIKHVDSVACGYWIEVGSERETEQNMGISHCLEHMVFKGTQSRTCLDIAQQIESVGGYLNAYTSKEVTAYYSRILKEDTKIAIDITTDLILNAKCEEVELQKERNVILQEISQTNDLPDDIIFDHFAATVFKGQNLARPILGSIESVKQITSIDLLKYKQLYTPDLTVFCAAGNLDHDDIVEKVQHYYNKSENSLKHTCATHPTNANVDQSNCVTNVERLNATTSSTDLHTASTQINIQHTNWQKQKNAPKIFHSGNYSDVRDIEQIHIVMGFEGVKITDKNLYTANLYSLILGAGMSSRLYQEVREKRGLVYSIYSGNSSYRNTGSFYIYAATSVESSNEVIDVTCTELQKIIENISDEELKRNKAQYKANLLMSLESTNACCEQLAGHMISFGRYIDKNEIIENIENITKEKIYQYASDVLKKNVALISVGPESSDALYEQIGKYGFKI